MPIKIVFIITVCLSTLLCHFFCICRQCSLFLGINTETRLLLQLSEIQYQSTMMDNCGQLGPGRLQAGLTFD